MAVFKFLAAALLLVATLTQVTFAAPTDTTAGPGGVTPTWPAAEECPGTYNGPIWSMNVDLLQKRADTLERQARAPRLRVIRALGEDYVRRLHQEFAIAAAGFRGMLPDARRLALEENLPCNERITILKRFTEKEASFTKKVSDAYGVLATKVREAIKKKERDFGDTELRNAADIYDSLAAIYLRSHDRAERQLVAAAKLT